MTTTDPDTTDLAHVPHGGPNAQPFFGLDFSVNTNPYGPNPLLLQALLQADHAHYPDPAYTAVRQVLAEWHGVTPEQVVLGVGASELMHRLARVYLGPRRSLLSILVPFGEMQRAAQLQGAKVQVLPHWQDLLALDQETPDKLNPAGRGGLLYVGQPHNPTGQWLTASELAQVAQWCVAHQRLMVLDLAYAPFTEAPSLRHPAVVALYSAGKAHGLVGARPAYALAPPPVAYALQQLAPAWQLPSGTAAVLAALPHAQDFLRLTLPQVRQDAQQLAQQLVALGQGKVQHAGTPYMTVEVDSAAKVAAQLLALGCKVRDCTSYGLPQQVRLSTRGPSDDQRLLQAWAQL